MKGKTKMDTNRLFLHSLIEEPHSITLNDCTNKLNKLSYLSKKPYNLVSKFEYEFNKEIIEMALEHDCLRSLSLDSLLLK